MKPIVLSLFCFKLLIINSLVFGQYDELFKSLADSVNIEFSARYLLEGIDNEIANFPFSGIDSAENKVTKSDSSLIGHLKFSDFNNWRIADSISKIRDYYINLNLENEKKFRIGIDSLYSYIDYRVEKSTKRNDFAGFQEFKTRINRLRAVTLEEFSERKSEPDGSKTAVGSGTQILPDDKDNGKNGFKLKSLVTGLAVFTGFLSFLGWIIFLVYLNRNTDRRGIPLNVKNYLDTELKKYINSIKVVEKKITDLNELNATIHKLENKVYDLQNFNSVLQTTLPNIAGVDEESRIVEFKIDQHKNIERYFLPFPDPAGFFWDEKKSKTQQSDTPYILELDLVNLNRGELSLINNRPALIRNAITSADTFLEPVCKIEGIATGDKITVISKGQIEKRNDRWQIIDDKKMVIRIHN